MRILVTNDDGINGAGLRALVEALSGQGFDVFVAGPAAQCSGSSASLGAVEHETVVGVRSVTLPEFPGVPAFAVQAPPALAVRAAFTGAWGPAPDLVVSGINPGYNTGRLVLHSGTVGAALTAASFGVGGIAVSTASCPRVGFRTAALLATRVATLLADTGQPVALNVNVPDLDIGQLAGISEGTVDADAVSTVSLAAVDAGLQVWRGTRTAPFRPGSDADLVTRGHVSVTRMPLPWDVPFRVRDIIGELTAVLA